MDFQSCSLRIFYRISNVVHGGCVDIFWNSLIGIAVFKGLSEAITTSLIPVSS